MANPFGLPTPEPLILAPMAEITHAPFRILVRRLGGCDLFFTEMLSSSTIARSTQPASMSLVRGLEEESLVYQISGSDPHVMGDAAGFLERAGASHLDINMGCSAPPIVAKGEGVALMKDRQLAREIVRRVRESFGGHLSAKLRLGYVEDGRELADFASAIVDEGVQTLTLHPRLKNEKFRGVSRWKYISKLRESSSVPVVGNGDVNTPEDIRRMREQTGCGGVMIGRGAAVRPTIFREAVGGAPAPARDLLADLSALMDQYLPKEKRLSRFKIFVYWFSRSVPFGHTLHRSVQNVREWECVPDVVSRFFLSLGV